MKKEIDKINHILIKMKKSKSKRKSKRVVKILHQKSKN